MDILKAASDWAKAEVFSTQFFILFAHDSDPAAFVESELARAERTLNEYRTVVFKAIPLIITVCALIIVFVDKPIWRASMISSIAMLVVILLIDGTAHARIEAYNQQLELAKQELKN